MEWGSLLFWCWAILWLELCYSAVGAVVVVWSSMTGRAISPSSRNPALQHLCGLPGLWFQGLIATIWCDIVSVTIVGKAIAEGGCLAATADLLLVEWMEPAYPWCTFGRHRKCGPAQAEQLYPLCVRCEACWVVPCQATARFASPEKAAPANDACGARLASGVPAAAESRRPFPRL